MFHVHIYIPKNIKNQKKCIFWQRLFFIKKISAKIMIQGSFFYHELSRFNEFFTKKNIQANYTWMLPDVAGYDVCNLLQN